MAFDLRRWRVRGGHTQVEAARALGVSQTYLSLMEKGARPVTENVLQRVKALRASAAAKEQGAIDDELRLGLAALGYPPFGHLTATRRRLDPAALLMQTLSTPDVDARVTEGLPWVAARYRAAIDWSWLTRQAKLNNFQNRLGFLLELTLPLIENHAPVNAAPYHAIEQARSDLDKARLLREATFCWDSMPEGMRRWTRANRSPSAEYWNVITRLGSERLRHEQQPPSRAPWDSFLSHLEGRVEWKRLPMSQVTFSVPDEMLLALKATPDALAARIRFAASVKLYEMGDLSSGAAAQLAGVPRPYFLSHLADYGVAAFNLTEEELTHDLKSA